MMPRRQLLLLLALLGGALLLLVWVSQPPAPPPETIPVLPRVLPSQSPSSLLDTKLDRLAAADGNIAAKVAVARTEAPTAASPAKKGHHDTVAAIADAKLVHVAIATDGVHDEGLVPLLHSIAATATEPRNVFAHLIFTGMYACIKSLIHRQS